MVLKKKLLGFNAEQKPPRHKLHFTILRVHKIKRWTRVMKCIVMRCVRSERRRPAIISGVEMQRDSSLFLRRGLTAMVFFAMVTLTFFLIKEPVDSAALIRIPSGDSPPDSADLSLERVLKEASMKDGTVILTTLNEAWADENSMLDLFLESFKIGYDTSRFLNHLVIVALDQKAFSRCIRVHRHCFALTTDEVDFSREAVYMTPEYLKMMWRRIDFLRSVLELGYNFLFTDADIMWFRDPFPHFYPDADFQIACDFYSGNSSDILSNWPNGGFNFVKSNERSIEFYKFWYFSREANPGLHDQDVLQKIKTDSFVKDIGLQFRFLDTAFFGGFCEPSKDLNAVCTMHANCCVGLNTKLHDLRIMLEDWKNYMSLPSGMKKSSTLSWRVPQKCSISLRRHFEMFGNGTRTRRFT